MRAGAFDQRDARLRAAAEAIAELGDELETCRAATHDDDVVPASIVRGASWSHDPYLAHAWLDQDRRRNSAISHKRCQ
jgi:hypothetical protein